MPSYTYSLLSINNRLTIRFYCDGKPYKAKGLGVQASTADVNSPTPALKLIMSQHETSANAAIYEYALHGGLDPFNRMFGNKSDVPELKTIFAKTNFLEYVGDDAKYEDITNKLLYDYMDWLVNEDYADNSISKYANETKVRIDRAKSCGAPVPADVYERVLRWKKGKMQAIYLTKSELFQMYALLSYAEMSEVEKSVLVHSLLSAYTGCRFSDVVQLKSSNIVYTEYENAEGRTERVKEIEYVSKKTGFITRVPFKAVVEELLDIPVVKISNSQANYVLPKLCEMAGISTQCKVVKADELHEGLKHEFVRSHTFRKSFATNVYISGEYDLRSIAKMVGHTSSATTEATYILCGNIRRGGSIVSYFN